MKSIPKVEFQYFSKIKNPSPQTDLLGIGCGTLIFIFHFQNLQNEF